MEIIDLGASANNGLGDKLRIGGQKINDNFTEIYDKLISDNFVVVKTLADFPAPVANVITLLNDTTYFITAEINTLGNSIVLGDGTVLKGSSPLNAKLYSSVALTSPLISSVYSVNITNISIDSGIYTTLSFNADDTIDKALFENVNFENCGALGFLSNYKNVVFSDCFIKDCVNFTFDFNIDNLIFDNCFFKHSTQLFLIENSCVIGKQFKVNNCFIDTPDTFVEINGTPTIPTNGFILESSTFTGGGTYLVNISHSDTEAYFKNNIGIRNTSETGFARYLDTVYTLASPLTINSGVTATLTNNANSRLETQIPSDMTSMFDSTTQKILAKNDGDAYLLSIRFKAKINVLNGYFDVKLDIGGTQGVISQESVIFSRGANTEQRFDIDLTVFSGSTFVANGGSLQISPQNGDMQIYDISFVIVRTHKAQ